MHLGVAVGARPIEDKTRRRRERLGWMSSFDVTLLAESGHFHFEQIRVDRAVSFVTVQAVFQHWRVFP